MGETNHDKNWIGSVFESITNGFNRMLEGVRKHGVMFSLFTMIIVISLWSLIINPIHLIEMIEHQFYKYVESEKDNKELLIERRYEANEIVGDIMSKLLFKFKCNRVLLLEKHNSVQSLGIVDFLYLSCTLEMLDNNNPEIDYISEDLQRQIVINLLGNDVIGLLKHSKYLVYDNLPQYKKSQCRLLNKLKEAGEKQVIIYPFCDSKHRPLMILVICGDNLNVKEIVDYVDGYSNQISNLLIFDDSKSKK